LVIEIKNQTIFAIKLSQSHLPHITILETIFKKRKKNVFFLKVLFNLINQIDLFLHVWRYYW